MADAKRQTFIIEELMARNGAEGAIFPFVHEKTASPCDKPTHDKKPHYIVFRDTAKKDVSLSTLLGFAIVIATEETTGHFLLYKLSKNSLNLNEFEYNKTIEQN